MTLHRQRNLLWIASTALVGIGLLVIVAARLVPYDLRRQREARRSPIAATSPASDHQPTLDDFAAVWNKPLRGSPQERSPDTSTPDAAAQLAAAGQSPPSAFRLAGTVVERGHCFALLITPEGQVQVKATGDECAGAKVEEITERAVKLKIDGRIVTLELPQPG
ncbi:MAG: hypothetical protein JWN40_5722 [Phycisphaerales bacterium]|nr:hypothetical protein [Phycisphaerales bacterium]